MSGCGEGLGVKVRCVNVGVALDESNDVGGDTFTDEVVTGVEIARFTGDRRGEC
jgi:hypothetical protein